jgi:hypothetical protein
MTVTHVAHSHVDSSLQLEQLYALAHCSRSLVVTWHGWGLMEAGSFEAVRSVLIQSADAIYVCDLRLFTFCGSAPLDVVLPPVSQPHFLQLGKVVSRTSSPRSAQ